MIHLLDVNVLVALFDPAHTCHDAAHAWFSLHRKDGWATCPLTENGLVRVIAHPSYSGRRTSVSDAVNRLGRFRRSGHHSFWADSVSLCDAPLVIAREIHGPGQITDAYLLALAVKNSGRLVTFDPGIRLATVSSALPQSLLRLSP